MVLYRFCNFATINDLSQDSNIQNKQHATCNEFHASAWRRWLSFILQYTLKHYLISHQSPLLFGPTITLSRITPGITTEANFSLRPRRTGCQFGERSAIMSFCCVQPGSRHAERICTSKRWRNGCPQEHVISGAKCDATIIKSRSFKTVH